MNLTEVINQIEQWATARDLDAADPNKQMLKLMEEVGELAQGLAKGNLPQVIDSIGDVYVVLTIQSMQLGDRYSFKLTSIGLSDCVSCFIK